MTKIRVEDLGKVAKAEVEISPLTILVGKNDTGKTYVANLIWAIGNLPLINGSARRGRRPKWLAELVKPIDVTDRRNAKFDAGGSKKVFTAGLKEFQAKTASYLNRVFAYDGFAKTSVTIEPSGFGSLEITITPDGERFADIGDQAAVYVRIKYEGNEFLSSSYPMFFFSEFQNYISDRIYYDVFGIIAFGVDWVRIRNPVYIPAARTGLMLSLASLVDEAMDYAGDERRVDLPLPLAQFLQRMQRSSIRPRPEPGPARELLLGKMIEGSITARRGPANVYRYTPKGVDLSLPLHAVSSMITELAPLAIDLRSGNSTRHYIFEEPEAHLHLEAQRNMARVIARLLQEGSFITLTTHSDTFLQQINNLMALYAHPKKKSFLAKFGYEDVDTINPKTAKAFEFCASDVGTNVREVKRTEEGFVVETLNSTLLALSKETIELRMG